MNKQTNWFLQNWEYQVIEGKQKIVYTGEYYSFGLKTKGFIALKIAYGLLSVGLTVLFYSCADCEAPNGEWVWAGLPVMLGQIPLIFLLLGSIWLLFTKEMMTYRDVRGSVMRIRWAGRVLVGLFSFSFTAQLFRLFFKTSANKPADLMYLTGTGLCVILTMVLVFLEHRFRVNVLPRGSRQAAG